MPIIFYPIKKKNYKYIYKPYKKIEIVFNRLRNSYNKN